MGLISNVTIAECNGDGCREHEILRDAKHGQIPDGWYKMQVCKAGDQSEPFIFHSLRCVEKWAGARRRITEPQSRTNGVAVGVGVTLAEQKRAQGQENREMIMMAFEDDPSRVMTTSQIADIVGVHTGTVRDHCATLVEEGRLRIVRPGVLHSKTDVRTYGLARE